MIKCQLWLYLLDFSRIRQMEWSLIYSHQCNNYSHLHTCKDQYKNNHADKQSGGAEAVIMCVWLCTCLCMKKTICTCIYKCTLVLCWSTFIVIKSLDLFVYVCVWSLRKQVSGLSSTMSQLAPQRGCTPPDTLNTHPWASSPTTGPIPTIGWVWGRTGDGGGEARAFSTSQMCQYNIFTLQLLITNTELQHCCTWAAPE